jgi:serpin B
MNKMILFSGILTFASLFACNESGNNNENVENLPAPLLIELSDAEIQMTESGKISSMNFFSTVHELQGKDENIVLSPFSLNMALAMVWNGAGGETGQAIQQAMCMSDYSPGEVNEYFRKLREMLAKTDPGIQFALANSIWYRLGFPVKSDFINTGKEWYNADVSEIDFSDSNAPARINQWCSDHTNGLIGKMIETVPGTAMMYLLNALYFKGNWADQYGFDKPTQDEPFTKEDGREITVQMMHQNRILGYYRDEYLALTALPYGNGAFSMIFILPLDISFDDLASRLKQENYWEQCLALTGSGEVDLYIPRFKTEYEIDLNGALKLSGMEIAFSGEADFSGISDIPLCISEVKQKAYIEVNETGTEAAVVTDIEMVLGSAGPAPDPEKVIFRADRPFLFVIQENSTGTILFAGKIGNPTTKN